MDKREQKIIAQINSEIESGKNLRLYRFCIVSLLFGWTGLQNLYVGRFFAAAIQLILLSLAAASGITWLIVLVAVFNYYLAYCNYMNAKRFSV